MTRTQGALSFKLNCFTARNGIRLDISLSSTVA